MIVVDIIRLSDRIYSTNNRGNSMATLNQHYSSKKASTNEFATMGLASEIINDYLSGK